MLNLDKTAIEINILNKEIEIEKLKLDIIALKDMQSDNTKLSLKAKGLSSQLFKVEKEIERVLKELIDMLKRLKKRGLIYE